MIDWLFNLFKLRSKYRLVPQSNGTYSLERYGGWLVGYMCESIVSSQQEADRKIANMEQDTIYYREE